jgi:precorrin-6B methylase 2
MIEEVFLSLFTESFEYFYREWEVLPEIELVFLSKRYDLSKIDKVVVVGAGAIPYTAIFFSQRINKPVYAIEKNVLAYFASLRLLRRLKISTIKVVHGLAQLHHDYGNSLIIITLHTLSKQMVLDQVMGSDRGSRIVVIRQPSTQNTREFESACLDGLDYEIVEHKQGLFSFIISSQFEGS